MDAGVITRDVLESYLNCKYLAHLSLNGHERPKSEYEEMTLQLRSEQEIAATQKVRTLYQQQIITTGIQITRAALAKGASFVLHSDLHDGVFQLRFDGLKRVEGHSDLGAFHYIPMLLSGLSKVHKNDRILLEALGVVLGRIQGRVPTRGVVYHGPTCLATSVRFSIGLKAGKDAIHELGLMQRGATEPQLLLNDHCRVCPFRDQCREQAIKDDNPTLLRGIGDQELKRYARRGLFTLTQIAHTFRPRRQGKHDRPSRVRHHALHALAIRDQTVYVVGAPLVPSGNIEIFLDIEGKPNEQFVYLIGMIICEGSRLEEHSFWADTKDQEVAIFDRLGLVLAQHKGALVHCYGSYEKTFLNRMRQRARRKKPIDDVLKVLVNTLSIIYAHFYFPTFSNGLKEIAALLGCHWSDEAASGVQSIVWRARWEKTGNEQWKEKLTQYNLEDCRALRKVVHFLRAISGGQTSSPEERASVGLPDLRIASVKELEKASYTLPWTTFANPDFAFVNKRAYFDYQRQRVFLRSNKALRRRYRKLHKNRNRTVRATQQVQFTASRCPECRGTDVTPVVKQKRSMGVGTRVKRAFDLRITEAGIRRRVIECRATMYRCCACNIHFTPRRHHRLARHFHGFMSWVIYQQVQHGMSIGTIQEILHDIFDLTVSGSDVMMVRALMARYYRSTYKEILRRLTSGAVLHADETEITLRDGKGYVWVFTSGEEVYYLYRASREGQFLRQMLEKFRGVLISDFYAPYDALMCAQQKCLIHLMRDMNQDILSNPFDADLQSITARFGALLRSIVTTVDKYGLSRRHLRRHAPAAEEFLATLSNESFSSKAAHALQVRLAKNKDKLFSFLHYDGIPWNNNNAEYAIKRLSHFREVSAQYMKENNLSDHLVLLSLYQTCRYKGVNFLKFLLSKETNIETFDAGKKGRHRKQLVEVYPRAFCPPHLAKARLSRGNHDKN